MGEMGEKWDSPNYAVAAARTADPQVEIFRGLPRPRTSSGFIPLDRLRDRLRQPLAGQTLLRANIYRL